MKIAVLDAATLGEDLDLSPLTALGACTVYASTAKEEVSSRLRGVEVVVVNKIHLYEKNLKEASSLRLICVSATGYDNIDLSYCQKRGIALCNVPAYSGESVAEVTLAMALALTTSLVDYRSYVHGGAYAASGVANRVAPRFHELSALTWGVLGGGGIGTRVAEAAKALGFRVLLCRRKPETRFLQADLDTLCRESDILSLHVPLTAETRGMISRRRIQSMKQGAILINVARGAIADEAALAEAVLSGHLGGLGVDVYEEEPFPQSHPFTALYGLPQVILTPHMAWAAVEARERCVAVMAENVRAFFAGYPQNRIV